MTSQQKEYKVFDSIKRATERLSTGLANDFLFIDKRIQLIEEWREHSWTWLYSTPDLVYDKSIGAIPEFKAFAEEIKENRRAKNSDDRKDYFHELSQFYNDELKDFQQIIEKSIEANKTATEKLAFKEPDQYAAGRPKLINPSPFNPQTLKQAIEENSRALNEWRMTPVGKQTEVSYEKWKETVRPFTEYHNLLLRLQSDVNVITKTIQTAVPGLAKAELPVQEDEHHSGMALDFLGESDKTKIPNPNNIVNVDSVAAMCYYLNKSGYTGLKSFANFIKTEIRPKYGYTQKSLENRGGKYAKSKYRQEKKGAIEKAVLLMTTSKEFDFGLAIQYAKTDLAIIESEQK